jgi:hypothetical protein
MVQSKAIIRVLQYGSKGLKEAPRPAFNFEILNVITNGQALALDNFLFLPRGKSFLPFLGGQRTRERFHH